MGQGGKVFLYAILLGCILILPGVQYPLFVWINGLVPLILFLLFYGLGWRQGTTILLCGVLMASLVGLLLQSLPLLLLTLTTLPAGCMVAHSAERSEEQVVTGVKATLVLGVCWLLSWGLLVVSNDAFSYASIIQSVQEGMEASLTVYRQKTIPVDRLLVIEQMITETKELFPRIFPAILGNSVMVIVWLTMVLGNRLALRFFGRSPWPAYKLWKLPDTLIWAAIGAAVIALLQAEPLRTIGINVLLLVSVVYIFQGISILVFFFDKWNMPVIFRLPLYTIAVIQASGTILLLIAGVADIWFDFRRLKK